MLQMKEKADYKVHILVQGSKPAFDTSFSEVTPTPSTSGAETALLNDKPQDEIPIEKENKQTSEDQASKDTNNTEKKVTHNSSLIPSTPLRSAPSSMVQSSTGIYSCHACSFSTTRLNVLILHNKTHSVSFIPYTPSPVRKKPKSPVKSTPNLPKTSKPRKPRKEKTEKPPKKMQSKKRASGEMTLSVEAKKPKTDEEIKSSLLADWDDDIEEYSNDESSIMVSGQSPKVPVGSESPAVPTPAELITTPVPERMSPVPDKKSNSSPSTEKPESSSDSKYEFCEDEDWPEEADFGRKIPRVKNPVRTEDPKNVGLDEDEVAREVAELLNKTVVPVLPSVPEPLRIEENFPEPSIVKSPDKNQDKYPNKSDDKNSVKIAPTKAIFKTKTFFRSRHSRSQDAIGKYVAEQLNAVERMDISENDINGSEAVSSPEARDSPPIEPVKVAKLAPKIQLKKMKAEAAQFREKEKLSIEQTYECAAYSPLCNIPATKAIKELSILEDNVNNDNISASPQSNIVQDVLYPTQEIKPLHEEMHRRFDTEILQETFTGKTFFIQEDTCETLKELPNHIEETQTKSKFEEDIPKLQDETTPKFEEGFANYKEQSTENQVDTTKFKENIIELEKEISNNGEVNIFEKETPEFEKTSTYIEEVQIISHKNVTSKLKDKTPILEDDAPIFELEPAKYEVLMIVENDKQESSEQNIADSKEVLQEIILNHEEKESLPLTPLPDDEPSLLENQNLKSLNTPVTKLDGPTLLQEDQIFKQLNEHITKLDEPSILQDQNLKSLPVTKLDELSILQDQTLKLVNAKIDESPLLHEENFKSLNKRIIKLGESSLLQEDHLKSLNEPIPKLIEPSLLQVESENLKSLKESITTLDEPAPLDEDQNLKSSNNQSTITKPQEQIGLYMNESTASAVDALLSVSRETDRVPRAVTNDLPEDLFEDDKDTDSIGLTNDVSNDFNEKNDIKNSCFVVNTLVEHMDTEEIRDQVESTPEVQDNTKDVNESTSIPEMLLTEAIVHSPIEATKSLNLEGHNIGSNLESVPSESDLQVAEALINLPATAIQNTTTSDHKDSIPFSFDQNSQQEIVPISENDLINDSEIGFQGNEVETETVEHIPENVSDTESLSNRFETEQEKSENLNAAQSLVQMSESIKRKINIIEPIVNKKNTESKTFTVNKNKDTNTNNSIEQNMALLTNDNISLKEAPKTTALHQTSSKLLKMLEEPFKPKITLNRTSPTKQIVRSKEKILNFDVAKSVFNKNKTVKQKIIIRRNATPNKTVLNKVSELPGSEKIILSRSGSQPQEGSSMQSFTIQTSPDTPSDASTIIIQQKIRKISKPAVIQPRLQKIKPQSSLVAPVSEIKAINKSQTNDEAMFDINSMPIVLSEDLLTPENIEKMPVVMSDSNIISQPKSVTKVIKPKQNVVEHEKVVITSSPHKSEVKTLLLNPGGEATKSATPNILSKSSKLRGAKPMLVIDKTTGKQKIIMTKAEPVVREMKTQPTIIQQANNAPKAEKFIILPTQNSSSRPTRTQKIVIDPQTGKAHMFVTKGPDSPLNIIENKPVSAKLLPPNSDGATAGNTVMIITNAQGAQSRIVLTPKHEKILFPNKQQPNIPQLKTISHRIAPSSPIHKTVVTTIAPARTTTITPVRTPARIVPKQNKSAIITSKGQLIVGGRVTTTAQNIAPMPELRPVQPKRFVTSEPKKPTQTVQKTNSEPIIFLQQKSGAVMQLTAAQFEHLQRTGQIVQKTPATLQEKIVLQKAKSAIEPGSVLKRGKKLVTSLPTPAKKLKQEIAIAPAPSPIHKPSPVPALATAPVNIAPAASNVISVASSSTATSYSEFDNFEELLPSTAIARQLPELAASAPATVPPPPAATSDPPAAISDQILAVPGEHFGALAGTFYLCVEENGTYTPIDNRPLVLENDQLVPMEAPQPERRDILEAALANSDVFRPEATRDDAPDFRDLNANVSVHCRVSETSTTLNQPIMTPIEVPSSAAALELPVPASLEAGLAVIGVTPHAVPTSLELPITVTDPRIALRATEPLSYGEPFDAGPISMPLLTDEDAVGKSMPILTDDGAGEGGVAWGRRVRPPADRALQLAAADLESRS